MPISSGVLSINDHVVIHTPWADMKDYPNVAGKVIGLRHGGGVAIIETKQGISPRTLSVVYLDRVSHAPSQ